MDEMKRTVYKCCAVWTCAIMILRPIVDWAFFSQDTRGVEMADWIFKYGAEIAKEFFVMAIFSVLTWFLLLHKVPKQMKDLEGKLNHFMEEMKKKEASLEEKIKPFDQSRSLGEDHGTIIQNMQDTGSSVKALYEHVKKEELLYEFGQLLTVNDMKNKVEAMWREDAELKRETAEQKEELKMLKEQIRELQQDKALLQAKNEAIKNELKEMQETNKQLKSEIALQQDMGEEEFDKEPTQHLSM